MELFYEINSGRVFFAGKKLIEGFFEIAVIRIDFGEKCETGVKFLSINGAENIMDIKTFFGSLHENFKGFFKTWFKNGVLIIGDRFMKTTKANAIIEFIPTVTFKLRKNEVNPIYIRHEFTLFNTVKKTFVSGVLNFAVIVIIGEILIFKKTTELNFWFGFRSDFREKTEEGLKIFGKIFISSFNQEFIGITPNIIFFAEVTRDNSGGNFFKIFTANTFGHGFITITKIITTTDFTGDGTRSEISFDKTVEIVFGMSAKIGDSIEISEALRKFKDSKMIFDTRPFFVTFL